LQGGRRRRGLTCPAHAPHDVDDYLLDFLEVLYKLEDSRHICGLARPENGKNAFCGQLAVDFVEIENGCKVWICVPHWDEMKLREAAQRQAK